MFSNLDIESKIWIFQTINPLSIEEENYIIKEIDLFLSKWTSHGNDLKSNYLIYKSHFIIISVDNNFFNASGCSLDKLFNKIKILGSNLNRSFFQREYIFFENDDYHINYLRLNDFKIKLNKRIIEPKIIYDNSVFLLKDLNDSWKKNISEWKVKFM